MNNSNEGALKPFVKAISFTSQEVLQEIYRVINPIEGWLVPYQTYLLFYIGMFTNGRLVEIGSWKGRSTITMLLGGDTGCLKMDCVDLFTGSDEDKGHKEILEKTAGSSLEEFEANLAKFNVKDRVTIHKGYSHEIAAKFDKESVDAIFIDGAHDYDNVKRDIISWLPALKKNCLMFGHDYPEPTDPNGGFEGLRDAVNENVRDSESFKNFGWWCGIWAAIKV